MPSRRGGKVETMAAGPGQGTGDPDEPRRWSPGARRAIRRRRPVSARPARVIGMGDRASSERESGLLCGGSHAHGQRGMVPAPHEPGFVCPSPPECTSRLWRARPRAAVGRAGSAGNRRRRPKPGGSLPETGRPEWVMRAAVGRRCRRGRLMRWSSIGRWRAGAGIHGARGARRGWSRVAPPSSGAAGDGRVTEHRCQRSSGSTPAARTARPDTAGLHPADRQVRPLVGLRASGAQTTPGELDRVPRRQGLWLTGFVGKRSWAGVAGELAAVRWSGAAGG